MTKLLRIVCYSLLVISFLFNSNQNIFAHNYYDDDDDYEKILDGEKILPHAILLYEPLSFFNLNNTYFVGSFFCFASLQGTSFVKARLENCDFYAANLNCANLTEALLCGSILLNANLENTKIVKANFANVVGLTNNQKEYLRKNGAINVPKDLSKEEFEEEFKMIVEWKKQFTFLGQLRKLCSSLFCCCEKKEKKKS